MRFLALLSSLAAASAARFTPSSAASWNVSYAPTFKLVSVRASASHEASWYVLAPSSASPPDAGSLAGYLPAATPFTLIRTPVTRAALLSSTQIHWAELLGARSAIVAVLGAAYVSSPCVGRLLAAGSVVDVTGSDFSVDMAALAGVGAGAVFCSPGWGCPGSAVDVAFPDADETSLGGIAEMAGFMSLFFDAEEAATALVGSITERLACTRSIITTARGVLNGAAARKRVPAPRVPRVLWAYSYLGSWYVSTCPNYYCEAILAAGGKMLLPSAPGAGEWGGYTDEAFAPLLRSADVWIYASDNWDSEVSDALARLDPASALASALAASPAHAARRIFDFERRGTNSWFEERPAQPDLLVQDLAEALFPSAPALAGAFAAATGTAPARHERYWIRNVFSEPATLPAAACSDVQLLMPKAPASDACPRRGAPSPLPSRSPMPSRSRSAARTTSPTASRSASRAARSRTRTRKA